MRGFDNEEPDDDGETEINLTPMLDVVFIMLIFFIVTAVFVREPGFEVQRPEALTAMLPGAASILVAVTADNEIWLDRRQIEIDGVRAALERLRSENPESGMVIQADRRAENQALIAVMDAAKQAGITRITIAARAP